MALGNRMTLLQFWHVQLLHLYGWIIWSWIIATSAERESTTTSDFLIIDSSSLIKKNIQTFLTEVPAFLFHVIINWIFLGFSRHLKTSPWTQAFSLLWHFQDQKKLFILEMIRLTVSCSPAVTHCKFYIFCFWTLLCGFFTRKGNNWKWK